MRQSILGFNQAQAIQANLDLTDLMLLQYIMLANGNPEMKHIASGDISYVWLSHAKILEDLPILDITEGTLRNKLVKLKKDGWVISETIRTSAGATSYYSVSLKAISLTNDVATEIEEPRHSEMTSPRHSEMTSDNKLEDNKLNSNNFTNVKLKRTTPARRTLIEPDNIVDSATPPKKKNKYQNCADMINETFSDEALRKILFEYLPVRLAMKDKPIFADGWQRLLNTLKDMTDDNTERIKIVEQSIDNGWGKFVRLKKYNQNNGQDKSVFSEYGKVITGNSGKGVIANVSF